MQGKGSRWMVKVATRPCGITTCMTTGAVQRGQVQEGGQEGQEEEEEEEEEEGEEEEEE